jgi:YVTN family beta-propeller protein
MKIKCIIRSVVITAVFLSLMTLSTVFSDESTDREKRAESDQLKLVKTETVRTGIGVKSVELSPDGSRIYSMNLEQCSVFEFNRKSRKLQRKIVFVRHPGRGFNYKKKVWISSYQEKPVEAHFTHSGRYLWISLHNADGIVVWDLLNGATAVKGKPYKVAWYYEIFDRPSSEKTPHKKVVPMQRREKIRLLWIKTGSTPKVISSSPDGRFLFVANWHSHTVSVLNIESHNPEDWKIVGDLHTGRIPRGLAVSPDSRYLYVAQMGSNHISVVNLENMKKVDRIVVGVNPRHLVISEGFLYSSLNIAGKLMKIDLRNLQIVQQVKTLPSPRTIAISQDGRYVFVVCYNINYMQVFTADTLSPVGRFASTVHPVGVTVYQNDRTYEVWVGNYTSGTIKIFTFIR